MLKDHQDILWLTGQVFLSRTFVEEAKDKGLDAIFAACPYGDLTEEEKVTFTAAFEDKELQSVVDQWWKVYDEKRETGVVPKAGQYWAP